MSKDRSVHHTPEKKSTSSHSLPIVCYCCGGSHLTRVCHFGEAKCMTKLPADTVACSPCSKFKKSDKTRTVEVASLSTSSTSPSSSSVDTLISYDMFPVVSRFKPIMLTVKANDQDLQMELYTGASMSIISDYNQTRLTLDQ